MRRQSCAVNNSSGVGVLDKAALVLGALEAGPLSLSDLVAVTELSRPTAYRLAAALEHHRLVSRDLQGRFIIGPRCSELATATGHDLLLTAAGPILAGLRDRTGESCQLYRRQGAHRVCIAAADRRSGLLDSVPIGAVLSMHAGSAAQVLLAWEDADLVRRSVEGARFDAPTLAGVRRRGWAQSVGEREAGVASVSAPVRDERGKVVGAVSVSGPLERLTKAPGRLHATAVVGAARALTDALSS